TVGLYLLGEVVQKYFSPISTGPDAREPGRLGTLTQVFVVSLLACLVSPFHYHALTLPPQLSYLLVVGRDGLENLVGITLPLPSQIVAAGQTLQTLNAHDPFTFLTPVSPFTGDYVDEVKDALRIAGLAYYVLLSAGVVSFILLAWSGAVWVWRRFFVWLGFALLSCAQAPQIAFFVVVAGPITALNIQDLIAQAFGTQVRTDS